MQLEALAATHGRLDPEKVITLDLLKTDNKYIADWAQLIPMLMDASIPRNERALHFHLAMANSLLQQAIRVRDDLALNRAGLAGGVFQNRVLAETCTALLKSHGFEVVSATGVPVNDAGISYGQIAEYAYRRR